MRGEELEKLKKMVKKCQNCPLAKTRKNVVFGEGSCDAEIMIIGQAPGFEEDKTGRPFVGRAGKFLDKLLEIAQIKREEVFITSPVKCFPPKNRKPKKSEIDKCLPWLWRQIEIIRPRVFILLGEVAFSVFFSNLKLKNFSGKLIQKEGKKFFITYHPAAGIRFPRIKTKLIKDFKKIKQLKKKKWQN